MSVKCVFVSVCTITWVHLCSVRIRYAHNKKKLNLTTQLVYTHTFAHSLHCVSLTGILTGAYVSVYVCRCLCLSANVWVCVRFKWMDTCIFSHSHFFPSTIWAIDSVCRHHNRRRLIVGIVYFIAHSIIQTLCMCCAFVTICYFFCVWYSLCMCKCIRRSYLSLSIFHTNTRGIIFRSRYFIFSAFLFPSSLGLYSVFLFCILWNVKRQSNKVHVLHDLVHTESELKECEVIKTKSKT